MTKADILGVLESLDTGSQRRWMFSFGYELTIGARSSYAVGADTADARALMGFNEIQHRVYGRIAALERQQEWTEASYISGVLELANYYGIVGQVGSALINATERFRYSEDV